MNHKTLRCHTLVVTMLTAMSLAALPSAWAGPGGPGGTTGTTQTYDTSFAVEYSYSCLTGGCHEKNTTLVTGYSKALMTHVMVKCNACHGTHTVADVGKPKPNLTGYYAGIGATGYVVSKDRCLVCHTAALSQGRHPRNPGECISCHAPHIFPAR